LKVHPERKRNRHHQPLNTHLPLDLLSLPALIRVNQPHAPGNLCLHQRLSDSVCVGWCGAVRCGGDGSKWQQQQQQQSTRSSSRETEAQALNRALLNPKANSPVNPLPIPTPPRGKRGASMLASILLSRIDGLRVQLGWGAHCEGWGVETCVFESSTGRSAASSSCRRKQRAPTRPLQSIQPAPPPPVELVRVPVGGRVRLEDVVRGGWDVLARVGLRVGDCVQRVRRALPSWWLVAVRRQSSQHPTCKKQSQGALHLNNPQSHSNPTANPPQTQSPHAPPQ